jgi:hypothetical protein
MSLGKSAWQAPSSHKVLLTGGVSHPKTKSAKTTGPAASATASAASTRKSYFTGNDHLSVWGDDLEISEPGPIDWIQEIEEELPQSDLLPAASVPCEAVPTFEFEFSWSPDHVMAAGAAANFDEMMLVDPRVIEGGNEDPVDDSFPDAFDLLEFVTDSSRGTDDPLFRRNIGDDDLFFEDVPFAGHSVFDTIDAAPIMMAVDPHAEVKQEPEVQEPEVEEEDEDPTFEPPAKRQRGRPRVPRTSLLKPLARYVSIFIPVSWVSKILAPFNFSKNLRKPKTLP